MGQCRGRPWEGQAVPRDGRECQGEVPAGPGGAHFLGALSSGLWSPLQFVGWAAKTSATSPKPMGSPLCQGGSAVTCLEVPVLTHGLALELAAS